MLGDIIIFKFFLKSFPMEMRTEPRLSDQDEECEREYMSVARQWLNTSARSVGEIAASKGCQTVVDKNNVVVTHVQAASAGKLSYVKLSGMMMNEKVVYSKNERVDAGRFQANANNGWSKNNVAAEEGTLVYRGGLDQVFDHRNENVVNAQEDVDFAAGVMENDVKAR